MSAQPAASVPAARRPAAHPTWERHRERARRPQRPRQAPARVHRAPEQGLKASPRWAGLTSKVAMTVDPSWAMSPGERQQSGRPGSAHARRREAPRSSRCPDATDSRRPEVAERTDALAARSFGACGAGA